MNRLVCLFVGLMLVGAYGFAAFPPTNTMHCYVDGAITTHGVTGAAAYHGGIVYASEGVNPVTTAPCIAHLPASKLTYAGELVTLTRSVMECHGDPFDGLAYYGVASSFTIVAGVWTWAEEDTGDVYVSTLPCTATPTGD